MSSLSLKDLLAEDGFKGRKSLTRARTSLQAKSPTVLNKDLTITPTERTINTQRTRSDVSRYDTRQQRDNLVRREKSKIYDSWPKKDEEESEIVEENERVKEIVLDRDTRKIREMSRFSSNVNKAHENGVNIPGPALDEAAIQATVSILSGFVKRLLRDRDLRAALRRDSLSLLNAVQANKAGSESDGDDDEINITIKLEEAIEAIETAIEESETTKELRKAVLQLSVIVGLEKDGFTSGIPNHELSSIAHLYLSIAYKVRSKDRTVAKHVLQVFVDSPFMARTKLLPNLWDYLFLPNLLHLKVWYEKESDSLKNDPERMRKIELLEEMYNEILDSGTLRFAVYYRDWLVEGFETAPVVPSIQVPLIRTSQPMIVRERFQNAVFGDSEGSSFVKEALTFSSETVVEENDRHGIFAEKNGHFVEERVSSTEKESSVESLNNQENSNSIKSLAQSPSELKPPQIELAQLKPSSPEVVETSVAWSSSIPEDLICPLTGRLFEEPVTLETGETFERSAIEAWLDQQGKSTCPVTSRPLSSKQVPPTNSVLKRVIETWKSRHLSAQAFLSLGGLEFLLQRFTAAINDNNLEDGTRVASLLVACIEADSSCRNQIASEIDRTCLVELLHSGQVKARESALLLLVELICLQRKKDVIGLLSELKSKEKGIDSTMHAILVYLHSSPSPQKPLIAVLLLYFDLLVEPRKYSIYREEAVEAITEALDGSLTAGENCRRAILILGGRFSSSGKNLTEAWILYQSGFKTNDDQNASLVHDFSSLDDEEEHINEKWVRNLCASLLGNGKKSFLKAISKCLGSKNSGLVNACLTTVVWLSAALASTPGTDQLQLPAFALLISRLKECLENGHRIEHKVLASSSLLNFSQISECRILLMSMAENITCSLGGLGEITWTAKKLHTILFG